MTNIFCELVISHITRYSLAEISQDTLVIKRQDYIHEINLQHQNDKREDSFHDVFNKSKNSDLCEKHSTRIFLC